MKQLKYVNSKGEVIDFRSFETRIFAGQFHAYSWSHNSIVQQVGVTVNQYTKGPLELNMTVAVRGNQTSCEAALNRITKLTEIDVIENERGKLWWGDYYLECNIISATTQPSAMFSGAERAMKIFAPFPFWIKEKKKSFMAQADNEGTNGLDYPYDYPYNYSRGSVGAVRWDTKHFTDSNFEMVIFGPCINPRVNIEGHIYKVNDTLEANELIVINSRKTSIIKYHNNGMRENIWNKQDKESSIFEPIPGDIITVTWSGAFGFDITLFEERSEPEW